MAYSDYGGYAYRNGKRVEARSDATISPEGDVFGSPSYVLDGEVFWGQDRLPFLDDALTSKRPAYNAYS